MRYEQMLRDIAEAIEAAGKKTSGYDTTAEVLRVEDNTAWVHIPGGVEETPVSLSVNAKAGDVVRLRVSGGQAWIVGNDTAPPTDDSKAEAAQEAAKEAANAVIVLDKNLTQEEIFERLTARQEDNGIYIDPSTGRIYIDATYILAGALRIVDGNNTELFLADADNKMFRWKSTYSEMDENGNITLHDDATAQGGSHVSFRILNEQGEMISVLTSKELKLENGLATIEAGYSGFIVKRKNGTELFRAGYDDDLNPMVRIGMKSLEMILLGTGTDIASGDDLNDYTEFGNYKCKNSTIAGTLSNTPITGGAFTLEVRGGTGDSNCKQTVVSTTGAAMFIRTGSGASWGSWYRYNGTAV